MAEGARTLIGVDCDPECKWRQATLDLVAEREILMNAVPHEPYQGNPDDIRPTETGYGFQAEIDEEFTGLGILVSARATCSKACKITDTIERKHDVGAKFGSKIETKIRELEG